MSMLLSIYLQLDSHIKQSYFSHYQTFRITSSFSVLIFCYTIEANVIRVATGKQQYLLPLFLTRLLYEASQGIQVGNITPLKDNPIPTHLAGMVLVTQNIIVKTDFVLWIRKVLCPVMDSYRPITIRLRSKRLVFVSIYNLPFLGMEA